jgi:hypothetical protein
MSVGKTEAVPLAALAVLDEAGMDPNVPIVYIPRIPLGSSYRDVIERAVGWSRR